jgi:cyclin-dependent kinase
MSEESFLLNSYEKIEKIGEGTYGKVYKARDKSTNKFVALKKTRLEIEEEGIPSTALREISLLQMLSESNHIVKLLSVEHVDEIGKPVLYLVFEYLTTDLKRWMDRNGRGPNHPLSKEIIKSMTYQLIKGVAHCHKHGVMHRDLKPQNLLIEDNPSVPHLSCLKVADLGLGRAFSIPIKSYTHEIVTLWYRAPEVLLGVTHYGLGVDIWSVGCIFAELLCKIPLFSGDSEIQQLLQIFKILGTPTEETWPGVGRLRDWHEFPQWKPQDFAKIFPDLENQGLDLLKRMLAFDPAKRISAKEALSHSYFNKMDKITIEQLEAPVLR